MSIGWNVIMFKDFDEAKRVAWFEEREEAVDEAERLNEEAPEGTFYGWQRSN